VLGSVTGAAGAAALSCSQIASHSLRRETFFVRRIPDEQRRGCGSVLARQDMPLAAQQKLQLQMSEIQILVYISRTHVFSVCLFEPCFLAFVGGASLAAANITACAALAPAARPSASTKRASRQPARHAAVTDGDTATSPAGRTRTQTTPEEPLYFLVLPSPRTDFFCSRGPRDLCGCGYRRAASPRPLPPAPTLGGRARVRRTARRGGAGRGQQRRPRRSRRGPHTRGSHSFTFQLNLSRVWHIQNTLHTLNTP